jgi:hypothetical protein
MSSSSLARDSHEPDKPIIFDSRIMKFETAAIYGPHPEKFSLRRMPFRFHLGNFEAFFPPYNSDRPLGISVPGITFHASRSFVSHFH